jgi:hypothetical protein
MKKSKHWLQVGDYVRYIGRWPKSRIERPITSLDIGRIENTETSDLILFGGACKIQYWIRFLKYPLYPTWCSRKELELLTDEEAALELLALHGEINHR